MKILCACEESQEVCGAFREKGHEAFSCDLQNCSGKYPQYHIVDDVRNLLDEKWDMIIGFPPCTYLTASSAVRLYHDNGIDIHRYNKLLEARNLFMAIYNADCEKICIENPRPLKIANLPPCDQIIQPYDFGHPYTKETHLWLKGLPILFSSEICVPQTSWTSIHRSAKIRSKTFHGIAVAMSNQWG